MVGVPKAHRRGAERQQPHLLPRHTLRAVRNPRLPSEDLAMRMTEELAQRVMGRAKQARNLLSEAQQTELLMDWLEGQTYKQLTAKYHICKSQVSKILKQARADAAKVLEAKK